MSFFIVDASDGNTPTHHASTILRDSLKQTTFARMGLIGPPNSGKPITVYDDLKNKAGETINIHFVPYADRDPILGQDVSLEGNEYSFDEYTTSITIDEVNFPFRAKGRMTDQRTILNLREELRRQIVDHFAQHNDRELFKRLSGIGLTEAAADYEAASGAGIADIDRTQGAGTNASRMIECLGTNSYEQVADTGSDNIALLAAMGTGDLMSPRAIMGAQVVARSTDGTTQPYRMQSIKTTDAGEWFLLFIGDRSAYDLKTNAEWFTRAVMVGEKGLENDPIAKGAMGIIDRVMIHDSEHIIRFGTKGSDEIERNLLLGQNAAALAFSMGGGQGGELFKYTEDKFDYQRELGATGTQIRAEGKIAFQNKDNASADLVDFGVLQIAAAANAPA